MEFNVLYVRQENLHLEGQFQPKCDIINIKIHAYVAPNAHFWQLGMPDGMFSKSVALSHASIWQQAHRERLEGGSKTLKVITRNLCS